MKTSTAPTCTGTSFVPTRGAGQGGAGLGHDAVGARKADKRPPAQPCGRDPRPVRELRRLVPTAPAARLLSIPMVVSLQGELSMDATQVYERSPRLRRLLRSLLREAPAVTACSEHTLREAEAWSGVELGSRGRVVHNGVSLEEFRRRPLHRESALRLRRRATRRGEGFRRAHRGIRPLASEDGDGRRPRDRGRWSRHGAASGAGGRHGERAAHRAGRSHLPGRRRRSSVGASRVRAAVTPRALRHREPRGDGRRRTGHRESRRGRSGVRP